MSTKPTKTATKAVKKTTGMKPTALPKRPAPKKRPLTAEAARVLDAVQPPQTPEERAAQGKAFMGKVLGDLSRLNNQVSFLHNQNQNAFQEISDQLEYQYALIAGLYDHLHIQMPARKPRLIDVQVELAAAGSLPPEEEKKFEMRLAYHATPHPVFGHMEIIFGEGAEATTMAISKLHPKMSDALLKAIEKLQTAGTLIDGHYYVVKPTFFHSEPINEESQLVQGPGIEANPSNAPKA